MKTSQLTRSQRRALEDLEDAVDSLHRWHGRTHDEMKNDETFALAYSDYLKEMRRAIRAGLTHHPAVREFVRTRQGIGSRRILRRARSGVEKGTVRQWQVEDVKLRQTIIDSIQWYKQKYGRSPTQQMIRRILTARGELKKMTRQAFSKLLERLILQPYFRK